MSGKDKRRARKAKEEKRRAARAQAAPVAHEPTARGRQYFDRARELQDREQWAEAEAAYRKSLRLDPRIVATHLNLAIVVDEQGRPDESIVLVRRALELEPESAEVHNNLATSLQKCGDLEEAREHFERALELRPDLGAIWVNYGYVRRYDSEDDPLIARMESQLARLSFNDRRGAPFRFALAKAWDELGQHERAFEHLARGNKLVRAELTYDPAVSEDLMRRVALAHDAEFLALDPDPGCTDEAPILIVGMARSGSTLVDQILASHSQVAGVGEVPALDRTLRRVCREPGLADFPERLRELEPAGLAAIGREYVRQLREREPDAPRIVDKTLNNFLHVGFARRALPYAKVIHCVRDPADTCLACFRVLFSAPVWYAYDLTDLGRRYTSYAALMRHWHDLLPGRILDVRYEDLVADQEGQTRRLLEFCDLEWEDACLAFHETRRPVGSASVTQVRRPIYRDAVERWRRYERHLGPLFEALGPLAPGSRTGADEAP